MKKVFVGARLDSNEVRLQLVHGACTQREGLALSTGQGRQQQPTHRWETCPAAGKKPNGAIREEETRDSTVRLCRVRTPKYCRQLLSWSLPCVGHLAGLCLAGLAACVWPAWRLATAPWPACHGQIAGLAGQPATIVHSPGSNLKVLGTMQQLRRYLSACPRNQRDQYSSPHLAPTIAKPFRTDRFSCALASDS